MSEVHTLKPLKRSNTMNYSNSGDIRSVLKQLEQFDDRDGKRDVTHLVNDLKRFLHSVTTFEALQIGWHDISKPLKGLICHSLLHGDTRKALSSALHELGVLSLGCFERFIDLIEECWKEVSSRKEERRTFLLQTLISTLTNAYEGQCFFPQTTMERICSATMSFLDSNNSVLVLTPAMELTLIVSMIVPRHLFIKRYFQDTVDVAIGWLVEEGQDGLTAGRLERTKEILLEFVPFWSEKMDLLLNLAKQFIEDMSGHVEDAKRELDQEIIARIKAIAGTLLMLIKICQRIDSPAAALVVKEVSEEITKLLSDDSLLVYIASDRIASIYAIYMNILRECTPFQSDEVKMATLKTLLHLASPLSHSSPILLAVLAYLTKLASEQRESLSIPLCSLFFARYSVFNALDFSLLSRAEMNAFAGLLKTLLNPSILNVLQYAYAAMVEMMKESICNLLCDEDRSERMRADDARRVTMVVYALKPILTLKNSLIVMLGLSPSLLDVVLEGARLTDERLQRGHPDIHYALLMAAVDHCEAHDNFTRTSDWLAGSNSSVLGESLSIHHLERIVNVIAAMMGSEGVQRRETRSLLSSWLLSLSPSLAVAVHSPLATMTLRRLEEGVRRAVGYAPETTNRLKGLLRMLEKAREEGAKSSRDALSIRSAIERAHEGERAVGLWNHLATDALVESYSSWDDLSSPEWSMHTACSSHHWEMMANFLLSGVPPVESANAEKDDEKENWLIPPSFTTTSLPSHWRKRLAAAAAYLIEARMTTHLGKPRETLSAFQTEMNRLFKQASLKKKEESDDNGLAPHEEWFRVRCLLEFIEILDRFIYLTHTGSMTPNFSPSLAARNWFTTNGSVCIEWFTRLYPCAMGVAFYASAYSQVIRFGQSALAELEKKFVTKPEEPPRIVMVVLTWMMRALIEKGEEDEIRGLQDWARDSFASPLSDWEWAEAAVDAAAGRLESAMEKAEARMVAREGGVVQEDVRMFGEYLILSCATKLRQPPPEMETMTGLRAEEMERCLQLTSFARVEEVRETGDARWNLEKGLERTETWLMSTIKKSELAETRTRLDVEGTTVLLMDDDGVLTGRYSSLCGIAADVAMKMDKNHQGIENPFSLIHSLGTASMPMVEALSLCRQKEGWAGRIGGGVGEEREKGAYTMMRLATLTRNWRVVEGMRAGVDASDVRRKMEMAEIMCRELSIRDESLAAGVPPVRVEFMRREVMPVLAEVYHAFSALAIEESMGSGTLGETAAEWGATLAKSTLRIGKRMKEEEKVTGGGMSKLHYVLESERAETDLDDKGLLLLVASSLDQRIPKARYELAMHVMKKLEEEGLSRTGVEMVKNTYASPEIVSVLEAVMGSEDIDSLRRKVRKSVGMELEVFESSLTPPGLISSLWQTEYARRSKMISIAVNELVSMLVCTGWEPTSARISSAALHLLSLLTKYGESRGDGLIQQIGEGMMVMDERIWAGLIPQLLARLGHSVEGVRKAIVAVIGRVGRAFPHCTVFPLVVAARAREVILEDAFPQEKGTTRRKGRGERESIESFHLSALLSDLSLYFPEMVRDTRMFVDQMHGLNLMEEKWCFVLHSLDMEMGKRLGMIRREEARTRSMETMSEDEKLKLMWQKNTVIVGPVYRWLRDFWSSALFKAQVGDEDAKRFVEANKEHVERAEKESEEARKLGDETGRWEAYVRLNVTLGRKAAKKGGQVIDISHCIKRLVEKTGEWSVPLPGQQPVPLDQAVHLVRVEPHCQVLSTKTRPKKMSMRGSDGVDRPFLLKTHEDLRLDERMMQILEESTRMMGKMGKRDAPHYTARTYAVTPLGPLLGLIQWVNGAVPLYSFYRKWQIRENAKVSGGKKAPDGVSMKPLELFEKKMKEIMVANKLDAKMWSDRKSWPPELMRALFDELCTETSKDLISREMWVRSSTAAEWCRLVRRFTRSTAVMSMIGALLGLGDRHPDNVLISMKDFHVIHIDYNVCFDRGRKLRVPETVPFRLTQNIKHAFGVAGVEGLFTSSCTRVLSSLRSSHSTLSLLLDPFIYDSLIDWTIRDSIGGCLPEAVERIVYGNDGCSEAKAECKLDLFLLKMMTVERMLDRISSDAFEFLEAMAEEGTEMNGKDDPVTRWIDTIDDMIWIARKVEGRQSFLQEERRMITKWKETLAWNGTSRGERGEEMPRGGYAELVELMMVMVMRLHEMNKECKAKTAMVPPGLGVKTKGEARPYREEENGVGVAIIGRVMKRVRGEVGPQGERMGEREQATQLIRQAGSRMNNALMYEGWIGWV